jgi:acetyl-CoA carboxylase carboxyltransferase component
MNTYEKILFLFDEASVKLKSYGQKSGFLLGHGDIDGRKTYFIAFNKDQKPKSVFEDFQYLNSFFSHIEDEPAPLVLMMDIPSSHKSAQQSPFPDDAENLLASKEGVARWYYNHARLSGKVPQTCIVFDKMGAALTFPVSICDSVVMLRSSGMSIGRLDVVSKMLYQELDYENLGGAELHATESGSIDSIAQSESEAVLYAKKYLSYLPGASKEHLPKKDFTYTNQIPIEELIPEDAMHILDMDRLIKAISDDDSFFELRESFAREVITGFATFNGYIAGIVANRSKVNSGIFFPKSSLKASRFISLCDSFGIPIVFLSDSAGFMIGSDVEKAGNIKSAAQLFTTISNVTTAKMSVIVRRAYTAGLYAMSGGGMMADRFVALESAIISIYGEGVARELMRGTDDEEKQHAIKMLESSHKPQDYLDMGLLDDVVHYDDLRNEIVSFVSRFQDGKRASSKTLQII